MFKSKQSDKINMYIWMNDHTHHSLKFTAQSVQMGIWLLTSLLISTGYV